MIKKVIHSLESIPATVIAAVCLLLELVPHMAEEFWQREGSLTFLPFSPAWISVVICGTPLVYGAIRKLIFNKGISKISSALLISVAMAAAIAIGDLFAAGEVAVIMAIGEILEEITCHRAKRGLKNLLTLQPTQGRRLAGGTEELLPAEKIQKGDLLRVLPGETIPVDGVILSGETSVDQSVMTGESLPVDKGVGDSVYCGTINRFGAIDMQAVKVGTDSSLQKLIRMVEAAEENKAPMARVADRWASWLVPVALVIAVICGMITRDIVRGVTVLVVFCPCALVLATPTAIMAAIGQAAKHGVMIKSGEALELMGRADTVAFDKTGTLTYGRLEVSDRIFWNCQGEEVRLVTLAASAEAKSEHPLGKAIVSYAKDRGLSILESVDFRMTAGRGVAATVDGKKMVCGSQQFLEEEGISLPEGADRDLHRLRDQGKALVCVGCDGAAVGVFALSDVLRQDAKTMVKKLIKLQTTPMLLTGDNSQTAAYFAEQAGISRVWAELLPEEKVETIAELKKDGCCVCMIGDGVNDAPALKTADVGVAMGSMGSDIAVEAADIALMGDDISKIPYLKRLSVATVRTIRFSIALSMVINLVAVLFSVLGWLNPTTGALVHNAGSCFVVFIAALLYDRRFV